MNAPAIQIIETAMVDAAPVRINSDAPRKASLYSRFGKRMLDIVLVLFMAPSVLPLVAVLALLACLDGKSPFYSQNRVGKNGRVFRMWKIRSMVHNADQVMKEYLETNAAARQEWAQNQKLRNDPRITKLGRFIRATSLDELPQLWNVLKGEMALVGPRPMMCEQRVIYPGTEYYEMRPGITGYWQISTRNESSFRERAGYDAAYYRDLSLVTDLKTLFMTVGVVLSASGI